MTSTFALGEEHNDFRAAVADFAARDLAPHVERWNAAHQMPLEAIKLMGNLGLFGLGGPEEYGGAGDFTSLCIAIEEIGKLDQSLGITLEAAVGLGINPIVDGQIIRLPIPELTEERRKQLVKVVRGLTEEGKVALRNIRRDVMHDLRELRDAGEAGSDDEHRAEDALQKLTDQKVTELDAVLKGKEEEILEV